MLFKAATTAVSRQSQLLETLALLVKKNKLATVVTKGHSLVDALDNPVIFHIIAVNVKGGPTLLDNVIKLVTVKWFSILS